MFFFCFLYLIYELADIAFGLVSSFYLKYLLNSNLTPEDKIAIINKLFV